MKVCCAWAKYKVEGCEAEQKMWQLRSDRYFSVVSQRASIDRLEPKELKDEG